MFVQSFLTKNGGICMKKSFFAALFAFSAIFFGCKEKSEPLRIYSIIHEEETEALVNLFTERTGIPATFLRASTGELVNRVISEKNEPQADILLGGATNYHLLAKEAGAFEPYISPLSKNVPSVAKSDDGSYTGFCVLALGIGVNQKRLAQKFPGVALPKTWEDLLNPAFKGEIVLTNPAASSTAYLFLQNQLQRLGQEKGWDYLKTLSKLVGQFPDSGSAPAKLVGTGEYALCVSYLHALQKYRADGFDVVAIAPPKTVGDVDCIAITKNTPHLEAAKKFVDFMLSKEAQELMSSIDFTAPVNPEAVGKEGSIRADSLDLIEYDSALAASQKNDVLEKWSKDAR